MLLQSGGLACSWLSLLGPTRPAMSRAAGWGYPLSMGGLLLQAIALLFLVNGLASGQGWFEGWKFLGWSSPAGGALLVSIGLMAASVFSGRKWGAGAALVPALIVSIGLLWIVRLFLASQPGVPSAFSGFGWGGAIAVMAVSLSLGLIFASGSSAIWSLAQESRVRTESILGWSSLALAVAGGFAFSTLHQHGARTSQLVFAGFALGVHLIFELLSGLIQSEDPSEDRKSVLKVFSWISRILHAIALVSVFLVLISVWRTGGEAGAGLLAFRAEPVRFGGIATLLGLSACLATLPWLRTTYEANSGSGRNLDRASLRAELVALMGLSAALALAVCWGTSYWGRAWAWDLREASLLGLTALVALSVHTKFGSHLGGSRSGAWYTLWSGLVAIAFVMGTLQAPGSRSARPSFEIHVEESSAEPAIEKSAALEEAGHGG